MKVAFAIAVVTASASIANADPIPDAPLSPRALGRAGIGLVSGDTGVAVLSNPAGLARRGQPRLAVALRLNDESSAIEAGGDSPRTNDRSGAESNPALGYAHGLGERWVLAIAATERTHRRRYARPQFNQPPDDVARFFPTRYAGLRAQSITRVAAVGFAVRATDWMAIGASVGGESIELETTRAIWAGFSGRDDIGDPVRDVSLTLEGSQIFVPRATAGVLLAPIEVPIEIAVASTVRLPAELSGTATATPTTNLGQPPQVGQPVDAELDRPGVATISAGVRYLGTRVVAEAGADAVLYWRRQAAEAWRISELAITDESGAQGVLGSAKTLIATRPHYRIGAGIDVAVIDGFLWLTSGYAFSSSPVSAVDRNPLLAATAAHHLAAGAEVVWSRFTVSLGLSRAFSRSQRVGSGTEVTLINPFGASNGTAPAATGSYHTSADRGALTVEYAFE